MRQRHTRRIAILALSALYLPAYVQTGNVNRIRRRQLFWGMRRARSLKALPGRVRSALAVPLIGLAERLRDVSDRLTQQGKAEPPVPEPTPRYSVHLDEHGRPEFVEYDPPQPLTIAPVLAEAGTVEVSRSRPRKRKSAVPCRKRLARMSKEDLVALARVAGVKGASTRWTAETLVTRLLKANQAPARGSCPPLRTPDVRVRVLRGDRQLSTEQGRVTMSDWECEICCGPVIPLGPLGRLEHGVCRNCGMQFSRPVVQPEVNEEPPWEQLPDGEASVPR